MSEHHGAHDKLKWKEQNHFDSDLLFLFHTIFIRIVVNREKHSVIGAILSKIFDCMEADVILNQFREELLLCLDHSNESIQLVCLKQVSNHYKHHLCGF